MSGGLGTNRIVIIWSAVMLLGLAILGASYLPILNPEQCPDYYTQAQVDESHCIIGVNFRAGLFWLLGIAGAVVGSSGLLVSPWCLE